MLLPADGVTNRYPIALHLIFGVYMVIQCLAGVGVPQRGGHVLTHQPGFALHFHGAHRAEGGVRMHHDGQVRA